MDILRLLDDLSQLINETKGMGPVSFGLNREDISMQIAKIRASLPQELKVAVSTVRESERIIDSAKADAIAEIDRGRAESLKIQEEARREASRIIEMAKSEQDRLVSESEILKLSKAQSEETRNSAEREALQMRRGAEKYAHDVLSQLEGVVGKVMATIDRGKSEIAPREQQPSAGSREKVRV
jgi:hypothetical protein